MDCVCGGTPTHQRGRRQRRVKFITIAKRSLFVYKYTITKHYAFVVRTHRRGRRLMFGRLMAYCGGREHEHITDRQRYNFPGAPVERQLTSPRTPGSRTSNYSEPNWDLI